jgi:hypothetical protein
MSIPSPQLPAQTRTRVKWDNILIVVAGASLAAVAVLLILASGSTTPSPSSAHKPAPHVATADLDAATAPAADGTLTLEDSQGLVEEAKDLLASARFDEAIDRLETVPAEFAAQTGSAQLEAQATANRSRYATMRQQLDADLEARQFTDAAKLVKAMLVIAPKDGSLADAQAAITDGLAPAAAPAAADHATKASTDASKPATGGATKASTAPVVAHPATTPTNPPATAGTTKPKAPVIGGGAAANTNTGNVTGTGTGTGATTLPAIGGVQLTQAQQQELADALAALG